MQPKTQPDPYFVLGIDRDAGEGDIRTAYRALVAKYHPDKHQGNPLEGLAAEKMAEVNRAYEILSDPVRRADYDRTHGAWPRPAGPGWGTTVPFPQRPRRRWLLVLGILLLLPLAIRIIALLVRPLARVFRGGAQIVAAARGTPLLGAVVLLAIVLLVLFLVRRRRHRHGSGKRAP